MDANKNIDDPKAGISRLFQETGLTDLHHHHYPGNPKPETQQCGSNAIDVIVGSPGVVKALVHAWISPFGHQAVIKGDHHLLGVDLDPNILFGSTVTIPMLLSTCSVQSKHPQKVMKFCKHIVTQCNQYRLVERLTYLHALSTMDAQQLHELEAIDRQLTKILLNMDKMWSSPRWIHGPLTSTKHIFITAYGVLPYPLSVISMT